MTETPRSDYYAAADSWADQTREADTRLRRLTLVAAIVASVIALAEAIAIIVMLPLKTVVPYTLLVDRQTGFVQELKPLERDMVAPDTALVRSFLVQYVIAREGFDIDSLKANYRKVVLWSDGEARNAYMSSQQASNPASPLATLPRRALVTTEIRSVSPLNANTALVRFTTQRVDPGGQAQPPQTYAATVTYRFSGAAMAEADRMINPLGFQVTRYTRAVETIPEAARPAPMLNGAVMQPAVPQQGAGVRRLP